MRNDGRQLHDGTWLEFEITMRATSGQGSDWISGTAGATGGPTVMTASGLGWPQRGNS